MVTMLRPKVDAAALASSPRAAFALLACLGLSGAAAQTRQLELSVSSELSWTSNSSFGVAAGEEDAVLEVRPSLRIRSQGGRVQLNGSASVGAVAYANRSQSNRVEPTADLSARTEAIERLFFVEAGYRAAQTSANAFGVRPDSAATANTLTISQWRLSPIIEVEAGSELSFSMRSDNTWAREIGEADAHAGAGGYFSRHSASIEQTPRPLGWRLEVAQSLTRYESQAEDEVSTQIARAVIRYAVMQEWIVGLRGGRERTEVVGANLSSESIYGFETRWQPSPRTTLSADWERRFFGNAWDVSFSHRRPLLAWTLTLTRGVDTTPQSLFDLPPTDNVAGLLDAIFTTRFPDPAERAGVVKEFILRQGLPAAIKGPISLFSERFSVVTRRQASLSLVGARNSFSVSGFSLRTEDALDSGPFAIRDASTNNVQYGAAAVLSHRLTPLTSLVATADWSRIRAIGAVNETTQRGLRVQVNVQAGPRSNAVLGGRYREIESNIAFSGREGAVFIGFDSRF